MKTFRKTARKALRLYLKDIFVDEYASEVGHIESEKQVVKYFYDRFNSEFSHKRTFKGKVDWFQGLAVNVLYWNDDVILFGKDIGYLPNNSTEEQEDTFLDEYWIHLARAFTELCDEHKLGE